MLVRKSIFCTALCLAGASAKVYLEERFDGPWREKWQQSSWKQAEGQAGEWSLSAGDWYGDEEADKGIMTGPDARFHTLYAELDGEFDNKGKDLVLQFSVKHQQQLDCGGGYIKLIPASEKDNMKDFSGDTFYSIMFGPDICGYTSQKVHAILTDLKRMHHENKRNLVAKADQLTHVYTLIIRPDNTYTVLIDMKEERSGSLYDDYDFLEPRKIKDKDATKPADWDKPSKIVDPKHVKPADWDSIPEKILDPEAVMPKDWDAKEDGEWEHPLIKNPAYKGKWRQKVIDNPEYKGSWKRPLIPNPKYVHSDEIYRMAPLKYVAFELWQVKSGSIFDNILVTDDVEYARKFAEETFGKMQDLEGDMFADIQRAEKEDEEEARKEAKAAASQAAEEEEDDIYEVLSDEEAEEEAPTFSRRSRMPGHEDRDHEEEEEGAGDAPGGAEGHPRLHVHGHEEHDESEEDGEHAEL